MSRFDSLRRDASFVVNAIGSVLRNTPSRRARAMARNQAQQWGYERGYEYGLRKARMQYMPGSEIDAMRGDWRTALMPITQIVQNEYKRLCARAELAVRTDAIAKRCLQILDMFVVGQGNRPYPAVRKYNGESVKGVNEILARDWERFSDQASRTSTIPMSRYEMQGLNFRTIVTYGNVLQKIVSSRANSLLPYSFQTLNPTRLDFTHDTYFGGQSGPQPHGMTVHGIQFDGRHPDPLAFWLEGYGTPVPATRIAKPGIDLAFFQTEAEQYLGLPWFTPVLPQVWDNQQLFFDKLKQSRIGARLGIQVPKKDQPDIENLLTGSPTGSSSDEYIDLDFQGIYASDGEIKPIAITDPISDTFEALVKLNMHMISMGLGFSYGIMSSDLNNSNYSAARANKIVDSRFFSTLYAWNTRVERQLCWDRFVEWEFLTGRMSGTGVGYSDYLKDPWYYSQVIYLPMDGEQWVDPLKDQQALILAYKTGQVSYRELCAMRGKSMSTMIDQLRQEREDLVAAGLGHLLPENLNVVGSAPSVAEKTNESQEQNNNPANSPETAE